MGFWDNAGEIVGVAAGKAYENIVDHNEKCAKYLDEMEGYSREELREVMMDSYQPSLKRAMARKLLSDS